MSIHKDEYDYPGPNEKKAMAIDPYKQGWNAAINAVALAVMNYRNPKPVVNGNIEQQHAIVNEILKLELKDE